MIRTDILDNHSDYVIYPLIDDELSLVVSSLNPLSKNSEIKLSDIKNEAFIFPEKGSGGYEIFYDACKQAGFEPNIAIETSHTSTIFSFVEENVGIFLFFKRWSILSNSISIKKGKILHSIKKEFIEYCKECLKKTFEIVFKKVLTFISVCAIICLYK